MQNAQELLASLGLTKTEAAIYRAGLALSPASATVLARKTAIKRPTVYHALETLMQKGLAAKKGVGARLVFSMAAPSVLKTLVERQIDRLEKQKASIDLLTPLLAAHVNSAKVDVAHYEGVEGVRAVVEEALYCRSRHWEIIAPKENFFAQFDRDYARYFLESRERRGIVARSLWEKGLPRHALSAKELRDPRWLPNSMKGAFKSLLILFDDKVAIISSYDALSAILISSVEIHTTFKAMFEALWLTSEPYRPPTEKHQTKK
jgi:sugar-specific transcriptional regulator TrmB